MHPASTLFFLVILSENPVLIPLSMSKKNYATPRNSANYMLKISILLPWISPICSLREIRRSMASFEFEVRRSDNFTHCPAQQ
jgi:hypothetical protein